ncbi:molybdenum cofactor biosynthesis protein MoaE [Persicirhabdus sediminis]|uniref:Molybdopterin synthase catalytic subunit n=1 Tax=Persicirhabdus sediminis TaxID=454144 RepID=A0A8J7MDV2_9BACT|nr:molybdenum cofactor biosynthesis protein MoaE [Persicirhabdus sediminis]MBK1791612.1 molybdenum cofactor biosynthesis protein MoaE [Persicirhabdus sediminis]
MFKISSNPIDTKLLRELTLADQAGGFVCFEGWVRDHHEGKAVLALEYEAWPELGEKEGARIIAEAKANFDVVEVAAVHRVGKLEIGDMAVCIAVSAAHRAAAFDACRYLIDEIKRRVPIWKKEYYQDGSIDWVGCKGCAKH